MSQESLAEFGELDHVDVGVGVGTSTFSTCRDCRICFREIAPIGLCCVIDDRWHGYVYVFPISAVRKIAFRPKEDAQSGETP